MPQVGPHVNNRFSPAELASEGLLAFVAIFATRFCVVLTMALDAARHCGYVLHLCDGVHCGDFAMAGVAARARLEMRPVAPINAGRDAVHAHPGNRLLRLCILGEPLNCRPVLANRSVTGHALRRRWERHAIAGIGIRMAFFTVHPLRQMDLVAVGKRLDGRRRWLDRPVVFLCGNTQRGSSQRN